MGVQVAAFTLDVVAVLAVVLAVHIAWGNALISALAALESAVFLWVLEARTGLTVGHLLLRVRSSREGAPLSPGAGRALLRQSVLGAGLALGAVGAWVIAASGAWDPTGRRRSVAARMAGTISVRPPARTRPARETAQDAAAPTASHTNAPRIGGNGIAPPRVVTSSTLGGSGFDDSQSMSATGPAAAPAAHGGAPVLVTQLEPGAPGDPLVPERHPAHEAQPAGAEPSTGQQPPLIAPVPGARPAAQVAPPAPQASQAGPLREGRPVHEQPAAPQGPAASVPPRQPAPPSPTPGDAAARASAADAHVPAPVTATPAAPVAEQAAHGGALLLVFDTGQRATLALGSAINLGRRPAQSAPTDQLVSVEDPEGTVSKTHARIEHARGRTWVTDQGSTNGTELLDDDGAARLEAGARTEVQDGMRIRLGNRSFTVSVLLDAPNRPEGHA